MLEETVCGSIEKDEYVLPLKAQEAFMWLDDDKDLKFCNRCLSRGLTSKGCIFCDTGVKLT